MKNITNTQELKKTKKMMKMNKLKLTYMVLPFVLLTGCMDSEKNKLDNRVADFWGHKINKEFDKAYEFLSPGWKSGEGKESYVRRMNNSKIKWLNMKLKEKTCKEKDLCTVISEIEYEYQFKGALSTNVIVPSDVKEKWIMIDNIWYQVPIKSNIQQK